MRKKLVKSFILNFCRDFSPPVELKFGLLVPKLLFLGTDYYRIEGCFKYSPIINDHLGDFSQNLLEIHVYSIKNFWKSPKSSLILGLYLNHPFSLVVD